MSKAQSQGRRGKGSPPWGSVTQHPPPSSGRSGTVPRSLQVSPHMASLDGSLPRRGLEDTRVCEDGPRLCRWGRDVGGSSPWALQGRAPRAAPAGSLLCPPGLRIATLLPPVARRPCPSQAGTAWSPSILSSAVMEGGMNTNQG